LILVAGCKKSNVAPPIESSLIGRWTYTENYFGDGVSPVHWQPAIPANQTIEFKSDGTFVACESFLKDADHFEILDSVTIRFHYPAGGLPVMNYSIDTVAGELVMSPVPWCIEGCAYKFKR
jgi:hypothetical protein